MDRMFDVSKRAIEKATGTLWPRRSIVSGAPSGTDACLTPDDFRSLTFIRGAICRSCGSPQDIAVGPDHVCSPCLVRRSKWNRARAPLVYDDHAAKPILALKRAGRRDGLHTMAGWIQQSAKDVLEEADLVTAVPLHRLRLAERGYNQAVWLAAAVSRRSGIPFQADILKRLKNTPSQGGMSARARRRNVSGAFRVRQKFTARIAGQNIVLVDDVLTTGATVDACANALIRCGAKNVDVVTVARVVREQDITI